LPEIRFQLTADPKALKKLFRKLSAEIDREMKKLEKGAGSLKKTKKASDELSKSLDDQQREVKQTTTAWEQFSKKLGTSAGDLKSAGEKLKTVGGEMTAIGGRMTAAFTLPLAAAGVASVKFAADFEEQMKTINTLVGINQEQVDEWGDAILELGPKVGKGPQELAEALFVVTSAGARGADAMQILENAAKASAIGLGETAEIARSVTAAVQAYGSENLNAEKATAVLIQTVREGNLEASDLAGSLGRVLGVASQVGVSFGEVGSFVATFTRLGVDSAEAVTALRGTLATLIKPANQTVETFAALGTTAEEFKDQIRERGFAQALVDIVRRVREMSASQSEAEERLAKLIPNIRALSGVLGVTGSQAEEFIRISRDMNESLLDVNGTFEESQKTTTAMWNQFVASMRAAAVQMGQALLPVVNEKIIPALMTLVDWIKTGVEWFSKLPGSLQNAVLAFAALLAAIGPILVIVGQLVTAVGGIGSALGTLGVTMTSVTGFLGTLGTAASSVLAVISGPAGWIAGITVLTGLLVGLAADSEALGAVWDALSDVGSALMDLFRGIWKWIKEGLGPAFLTLASAVKDVVGPILSWFADILKVAINFWLQKIADTLGWVADRIRAFGEWLGVAGKDADAAADSFKAVTEELADQGEELGTVSDEAEDAGRTLEQLDKIETGLGKVVGRSTDEIEREAKALEALKSRTRDLLNPAANLEEMLIKLNKEGFSKEELIAAYGKQIIDAAKKQRELNTALGESNKELPEFITGLEEAARKAEGHKNALKIVEAEKKKLNRSIREGTALIMAEVPQTVKLSDEFGVLSDVTLDVFKRKRELAQEIEDVNTVFQELTQRGFDLEDILVMIGRDGGALAKMKDQADKLGIELSDEVRAAIEFTEELQRNQEEAEKWEKVWSTAMGNITSNFAQGLSDIIFEGKSFGETMKGMFKQLGSSLLQTTTVGLMQPLAGAFSKLSDKIGGGISGLFGGLKLGGLNLGGLFGGLAGGLVSGLVSGGLAMLPGLITKGVGALVGLFKKTAKEKFDEETVRDFSGLGNVNQFITETLKTTAKALEHHRKETTTLFAALQGLTGKTTADVFIKNMSRIAFSAEAGAKAVAAGLKYTREGGSVFFDLSDAARQAVEEGNMEEFGRQLKILLDSAGPGFQQAIGVDYRGLIDQVIEMAGGVDQAASSFERLDEELQDLVTDFLETGRLTDELKAKFEAVDPVLAASVEGLNAELRATKELQNEFGTLRNELEELLPATQGWVAQFLETGELTDEIRKKINELGGDVSKFEAFTRIVQEAQAAGLSLAEFIADNEKAQAVVQDVMGEVEGLQDTLASAIEDMTKRFEVAIERLIDALANVKAASSDTAASINSDLADIRDDTGSAVDAINSITGIPFGDVDARYAQIGSPPGIRPPGGQIGGFVERSGLAFVHAGEEIINRRQSAAMSRLQQSFADVFNARRGGEPVSRMPAGGRSVNVSVNVNSPITVEGDVQDDEALAMRINELMERNAAQIAERTAERIRRIQGTLNGQ